MQQTLGCGCRVCGLCSRSRTSVKYANAMLLCTKLSPRESETAMARVRCQLPLWLQEGQVGVLGYR